MKLNLRISNSLLNISPFIRNARHLLSYIFLILTEKVIDYHFFVRER